MEDQKIEDILAGIKDGLEILTSSMELKMQTGRIKNAINSNQIDKLAANTAAALLMLNGKLESALKAE